MSIIGSNSADIKSTIKDFLKKSVATNAKIYIEKGKGKLLISVKGDVIIANDLQTAWFPSYVKFNYISGNFTCFNCKIQSMHCFPSKVDKNFICMSCSNIISLDGIPNTIGGNCTIRNCGRDFSSEIIKSRCNVLGEINKQQ